MQMVNDPLLSPLLLQMAVYSAIDATERTVGAATIRVTGEVEFQNAPAPIQIDNMFSGDNGSAMQVSLSTAIPLAYVMQSGFRTLDLKKVAIRIDAYDQKKQLTIDGVTPSQREAHPGDKLQLTVLTERAKTASKSTRQVDYAVPVGAEPGILYFTVADANIANLVGLPPDPHRHPAQPCAGHHHREQPAPQYQGLRPRVARRPRLSTGRRRPARSAGLGRADSVRLAIEPRRGHADAQFENRERWRSTAATW